MSEQTFMRWFVSILLVASGLTWMSERSAWRMTGEFSTLAHQASDRAQSAITLARQMEALCK